MKTLYSKELGKLFITILMIAGSFAGTRFVERQYLEPINRQSIAFVSNIRQKESKIVSDIEFVESYAEKAKKINADIFKEGAKSGGTVSPVQVSPVFSLPNWHFYKDTDRIMGASDMSAAMNYFGVRFAESEMYWRNGEVKQAVEHVAKNHAKFRSSGSKQFFVSGEEPQGERDYAFITSSYWVSPRGEGDVDAPVEDSPDSGAATPQTPRPVPGTRTPRVSGGAK